MSIGRVGVEGDGFEEDEMEDGAVRGDDEGADVGTHVHIFEDWESREWWSQSRVGV